MWHLLHLIAAPVEFLLGAFCLATAILLYPGEDGKIQSKLEDFWVHVDDTQHRALSRATRFMTAIARFETRVLDSVFGSKLISWRSIGVSVCFSLSVTVVLVLLIFP